MSLTLTQNQDYRINGLDFTVMVRSTTGTGTIWINHAGSNWLRYEIKKINLAWDPEVWELTDSSVHTNRHQKGMTQLLQSWLFRHSTTLCNGKS